MALGWGIGFFIAIMVGMILLRIFFKTAFKIMSIIWFVLFLAGIALSILVYADVKSMRDTCPEMPPVFLAEDDDEILAGMKMNVGEEAQEKTLKDMFITDTAKYQEEYDKNEFEDMLEDEHCKIALFNMGIFQNFSDMDFSDEFSMPVDIVIEIIESNSPVDVLIDHKADEEGLTQSEKQDLRERLSDEIGTPVQLKSFLFAGLIAAATDQEGPSFLIKNFQEDSIRVRKETILFKFMKYMPYSLFDEMIGKMMPKEVENGNSG